MKKLIFKIVSFSMILTFVLFVKFLVRLKTNLDTNKRLIVCINNADIESVLDLIGKGADPNYQNLNKKTSFFDDFCEMILGRRHHYALSPPPIVAVINSKKIKSSDKNRLVNVLLDKQANPNVMDAEGHTLLNVGIMANDYDIVHKVLSFGVDPNKADSLGILPLAIAVSGDKFRIVKLLIDQGANVNMNEPYSNWTPLMWAAYSGKERSAQLLIARGANGYLLNKNGDSAYGIAMRQNNLKIAEIIKNANSNHQISASVLRGVTTHPPKTGSLRR